MNNSRDVMFWPSPINTKDVGACGSYAKLHILCPICSTIPYNTTDLEKTVKTDEGIAAVRGSAAVRGCAN